MPNLNFISLHNVYNLFHKTSYGKSNFIYYSPLQCYKFGRFNDINCFAKQKNSDLLKEKLSNKSMASTSTQALKSNKPLF